MNKTNYFILIMISVFVVTYGVLFVFGLTPKSFSVDIGPKNSEIVENTDFVEEASDETSTRPDKITIDKIGVESIIGQPNSRDISVLDQFLNNGAVHYPGSGTVESGNMFLFGHSTGFSVVNNQAYKTFNNLNKLENNDEIVVEADGKEYIYKVSSVQLVDENTALVEFDDSKRTLTISTCNSFGEKQERWVVQAEFDREVAV